MEMVRCFKIGKTDHYSRECPNERTCYNCGEAGHVSRDCKNAKAGGSGKEKDIGIREERPRTRARAYVLQLWCK
ncbi:hypothetical protein L1987_24262 [Smallanthus sonchifolius]|uniref:Uncharacterized protein n=1 Tax=Smallanthus sonchifolius TaxID=185202 RepID=A0ACB9IJ72_9ASTR|nr:hypothetical protein L1987_24262 [Smallanthus sonchifolius]